MTEFLDAHTVNSLVTLFCQPSQLRLVWLDYQTPRCAVFNLFKHEYSNASQQNIICPLPKKEQNITHSAVRWNYFSSPMLPNGNTNFIFNTIKDLFFSVLIYPLWFDANFCEIPKQQDLIREFFFVGASNYSLDSWNVARSQKLIGSSLES